MGAFILSAMLALAAVFAAALPARRRAKTRRRPAR
jgi:hypothetical protein